jgi:hypothetical protein
MVLTVELGPPEDLHLADAHIMQGEHTLARLLNILGDGVRDELVDKLLCVVLGDLASHDLHHLLADDAHLVALGVAGLLDLVLHLLGEADAEHAQEHTVGGLYINMGLDQGLEHITKY